MDIKKTKLIVICGPTAVGKSALAVRLAKEFNGEIISADSRQVYRGLNIGAGKITKKEMRGVPHHMLDVANPKKRFTVVEFQEMARKKITEIFSRGKIPIICGGTGFYISALVDGVQFPDVPPNPLLRASLEKKSAEKLFEILKKLDPRRATEIDPRNKRRVIRAIEIARALGKVPFVDTQCPQVSVDTGCLQTLWIGINLSPKKLCEKINIRLFARMRQGMVAEAKKLHRQGLSWKRMGELGLEYRYLAHYFTGKIPKDEMIVQLGTAIWHYARRQMTWFKGDKRIKWFLPTEYKRIEKVVTKFIGKRKLYLPIRANR